MTPAWISRCVPSTSRNALLATIGSVGLAISALQPADAHPMGSMPAATTSHYMRTVAPGVLARMGCAMGQAVREGGRHDALVILAFGSPRRSQWHYGVSLFQGRFAASTTRIRVAVQSYAGGFADCTRGLSGIHLRIAVGTSNYGPEVTYGHGTAWARMVNKTNVLLAQLGLSWKVDVVGANDIEPGYNPPGVTKRWVEGYDDHNAWPYYNFGGAASCPPFGDCQGAWTQEDIWYVSWGAAPALPLPQIYTDNGASARQWYLISLHGSLHHGDPMRFVGVLTQQQACRDTGDRCRDVNNTPSEAWAQLSSLIQGDGRTAQVPIRWATDISWTN